MWNRRKAWQAKRQFWRSDDSSVLTQHSDMAQEKLSFSFATSSLIEEECFECDTQPRADSSSKQYSEIIYDVKTQRANGYYLPVTLATTIDSLPADVALWLIELRHCSESTDIVREVPQAVIVDGDSSSGDNHSVTSHTYCSDDQDRNSCTENIAVGTASREFDKLSQDSNEIAIPDILNIWEDYNTENCIGLEYNDALHISQDGLNNEHFQIWEGLQIPRLSLIPATCRTNLELDINFESAVRGSIGLPKMEKPNSFWEVNPVYSMGSLQNDSSVNEKSINDHGEWIPCNKEFTTLDGEYRKHYDMQRKQEWIDLNQVKGNKHKYSSSDSPIENQSTSMETLAESQNEQKCSTMGTILNRANNYMAEPPQGTNEQINPSSVVTGIDCTPQDRRVKKQHSDLHLKCDNILNNLDEMIEKFEDIKKVFLYNDENIEDVRDDILLKDNEFIQMCASADYIIEETLKCHVDPVIEERQNKLTPCCFTNKLNNRFNPLDSTSSDSYDEVFHSMEDCNIPAQVGLHKCNTQPSVDRFDSFTKPSMERTDSFSKPSMERTDSFSKPSMERTDSFNINEIFDKSGGENSNKPIPPARKKKIHVGLGKTLSYVENSVDKIIGQRFDVEKVEQMSESAFGNSNAVFNVNNTRTSQLEDSVYAASNDDKIGKEKEMTSVTQCPEMIERTENTVNEGKKEVKIFRITNMNVKVGAVEDQNHSVDRHIPSGRPTSNSSELSAKLTEGQSIQDNSFKDKKQTWQMPTALTEEKQKLSTYEKQPAPNIEKQKLLMDDKPAAFAIKKQNPQIDMTNSSASIDEKIPPWLGETLIDKSNEKLKALRDVKPKPPVAEKRRENHYVNWSRIGDQDKRESQSLDVKTEPGNPSDLQIYLTPTKPISSTTFPNDSQNKSSVVNTLKDNTASTISQSTLSNNQRMSTFQQISNIDINSRTKLNKTNSKELVTRRSMPPNIQESSHKSLNLLNTSQAYNLIPTNTSSKSNKCDAVYIPLGESAYDLPAKPSSVLVAASSPLTLTHEQEQELLERTRKGSTASDVAEWKETLIKPRLYYHDDEMDPNSIPSNEWFSSKISSSLNNDTRAAPLNVPDINITLAAAEPQKQPQNKPSVAKITKLIEAELRGKQNGQRDGKSKSLVLTTSIGYGDDKNDNFILNSTNWTEFWSTNKLVLREGILSRTKFTENGKKVRKNWVTSYVVLTEPYILIFKDVKTFHAMKISTETFLPEMCMDLCGAYIEIDEKLSSRKNVFVVSTIHGLQVLLQAPSSALLHQWVQSMQSAITSLPGHDTCPRIQQNTKKESSPTILSTFVPEEKLKIKQFGRTRSIRITNNESSEDLTASVEERQTKTRARLKKFFNKRPSKESLVKKGIYKDEPMFGCSLCDVVPASGPCIPQFVLQCIRAIEEKPESMKTDGLYRASGNLSQVQKIRLQVDQNNLAILDDEEDIHVLTGVLKLFFRELKKPLIPFELFNRAIAASSVHNQKERVHRFRELVQDLPPPNHDTLDYLLQHLLRVTQNQEHNRMHIPNIAIVFGPTLMRPEEESLNMALDLMKQNLVIECLLVDYKQIFG